MSGEKTGKVNFEATCSVHYFLLGGSSRSKWRFKDQAELLLDTEGPGDISKSLSASLNSASKLEVSLVE